MATPGATERRARVPPCVVWCFYVIGVLYLLMLVGTIPPLNNWLGQCDPSWETCVSLASYYGMHWWLILMGMLNMVGVVLVILIVGGCCMLVGGIADGSCAKACCNNECTCKNCDWERECECCSPYEPI